MTNEISLDGLRKGYIKTRIEDGNICINNSNGFGLDELFDIKGYLELEYDDMKAIKKRSNKSINTGVCIIKPVYNEVAEGDYGREFKRDKYCIEREIDEEIRHLQIFKKDVIAGKVKFYDNIEPFFNI